MSKPNQVQQAIDKIDAEVKALLDLRQRLVDIRNAQPKRKTRIKVVEKAG